MIRGIGSQRVVWTCSQTINGHDPVVTSCKPPVQVIAPRGEILASRTDDSWSWTFFIKANDQSESATCCSRPTPLLQNGQVQCLLWWHHNSTSGAEMCYQLSPVGELIWQFGASLEENLYGHPLARLLMGKAIRENYFKKVGKKFQIRNASSLTREKGLFLSVHVDDIKLASKTENIEPTWKNLMEDVDLGEPTSFLDHVYWVALKESVESAEICKGYRKNGQQHKQRRNLMQKQYLLGPTTWKVTRRNAWKIYCELAEKTTEQLCEVATPCMDDHQFKDEEKKSVRELSTICSQLVLKCLFLARIERPDILWSVNMLARAITKWTKPCDKRLARLISYIHHTNEYQQYGCGKHSTTMQTRIVSRLWFCKRPWKSLNQHQEKFCAFSEVTHVCQQVGGARNRLQFHTILQKLKSFLSMQVYAWTVFPLSLSGDPRESHCETVGDGRAKTCITRSQ